MNAILTHAGDSVKARVAGAGEHVHKIVTHAIRTARVTNALVDVYKGNSELEREIHTEVMRLFQLRKNMLPL